MTFLQLFQAGLRCTNTAWVTKEENSSLPTRRNPHTATHHLLLVKTPKREVCLDKRISSGLAASTRASKREGDEKRNRAKNMLLGLQPGEGRRAPGVERLRGLRITLPPLANADEQSPASLQQAYRLPLCHNNSAYAPHTAFPSPQPDSAVAAAAPPGYQTVCGSLPTPQLP